MSPTTGYQRNMLNEGVKNVTDSDVKPVLKLGHCDVKVDLPSVTETPKRSGLSEVVKTIKVVYRQVPDTIFCTERTPC